MHSFRALLKAEFTVEVISQILFSGKFPRLIAIFVVLLYCAYGVARMFVRFLVFIYKLIFVNDDSRARTTLREVRKVGHLFGDRVGAVTQSDSGWNMALSNPRFARNIQLLQILIEPKTSRIRIWILVDGQLHPLSHSVIESHCSGVPISLHRDHLVHIIHQLHLNYL